MQITLRFSAFFLVLALVLSGLGFYVYKLYPRINQSSKTSTTQGTELISIRTAGGTMEVAALKTTERFIRTDTKNFGGISLGETISQINVPVYYRYHINLAEAMPVACNAQKICIVHVNELQATLPVAFDSTKMEKYTANGWARFNKNHNLLLLEQSITPVLATRAELNHYKQQAQELGRKTISEFVQKWLLKEKQWRENTNYKIIVLYPNEKLEEIAYRPETINPITVQPKAPTTP